jgi:hypothetical protein
MQPQQRTARASVCLKIQRHRVVVTAAQPSSNHRDIADSRGESSDQPVLSNIHRLRSEVRQSALTRKAKKNKKDSKEPKVMYAAGDLKYPQNGDYTPL